MRVPVVFAALPAVFGTTEASQPARLNASAPAASADHLTYLGIAPPTPGPAVLGQCRAARKGRPIRTPRHRVIHSGIPSLAAFWVSRHRIVDVICQAVGMIPAIAG